MKITLQNGDTLERKFESFYIYSQQGDNVHINDEQTKIPEENRLYFENGDSCAILSNQLYLFTKCSHVYVNDEKRFYVFPAYVSDSFREFCSQSLHIERKEIHGQSFVTANFEVSDMPFKLVSPSTQNGQYTVIFQHAFPTSGANIAQKVEMMQKKWNELYHCHIEYSPDKNVLIAKMKQFDFNLLFRLIYELTGYSGQHQSSHFTA